MILGAKENNCLVKLPEAQKAIRTRKPRDLAVSKGKRPAGAKNEASDNARKPPPVIRFLRITGGGNKEMLNYSLSSLLALL